MRGEMEGPSQTGQERTPWTELEGLEKALAELSTLADSMQESVFGPGPEECKVGETPACRGMEEPPGPADRMVRLMNAIAGNRGRVQEIRQNLEGVDSSLRTLRSG